MAVTVIGRNRRATGLPPGLFVVEPAATQRVSADESNALIPVNTPAARRVATLWHEAAHAFTVIIRGGHPESLSVDGHGNGRVVGDASLCDEDQLAVNLAGTLAETFFHYANDGGSQHDLRQAAALSERLWPADGLKSGVDRVSGEVVADFERHRRAISVLADELDLCGKLSGDDAVRILRLYGVQPRARTARTSRDLEPVGNVCPTCDPRVRSGRVCRSHESVTNRAIAARSLALRLSGRGLGYETR